ncbi:MAG TPA: peptide chain release factor N(5)-glutamine methyltransferase [Balneolaceae bacterium]|nr:peptide chain release factor N(5)-glutamine methyltransferase [Balneolaceae bacterium]
MNKKPDDWTVLSMLEWATDYFKSKNIPDPRHSIEWLLAEMLGVKRLDLYLKFDRPLSPAELDRLRPLVKRRADHEPLQYITGFSEFMNARISVTPAVLIPRLETEQLVETMLAHHPDETLSVLDIGTGSGCIPIALKMERPGWQLSAIDISDEALSVARENARQNEVEINFSEGNILSPETITIDGRFDVIVSNPPYISPNEKEILEPQVREFEPHTALFFNDIEMMYQKIIEFSLHNLSENGCLYLELHEQYSAKIMALFDDKKWDARLLEDYDKKPRFIIANRL